MQIESHASSPIFPIEGARVGWGNFDHFPFWGKIDQCKHSSTKLASSPLLILKNLHKVHV